jgi:NDP-sugar pyrophosphorylase family protein
MCGVILAAGEGTRLAPLTADRPKPPVSVLGRPLLDYTL